MVPMRAVLVLLTILSFSTPAVSWSVANELSPLTASSMSLATPAGGSQFVRATAKTDKTFSSGFAIAPESPALLSPSGSIESTTFLASDAPNLDLASPPLAPRPPPSR